MDQRKQRTAVSPTTKVTLVRLTLLADETECQRLARLLSADEQERANRRFADVRRRAVVSRGRLRVLLGSLLGIPASAVDLTTGAHGKPALAGRLMDALAFNVSHSGDEAVIALSHDGPLGVDLEVRKPTQTEEWAQLMAGTIFSDAERARWQQASDRCAVSAVLDAWVTKEAVFKAAGTGIGDRLRQCVLPDDLPRVSLRLGHAVEQCSLSPVSVSAIGSPFTGLCTTLIDVGADCHVAIACKKKTCVLELRSFDDVLDGAAAGFGVPAINNASWGTPDPTTRLLDG